MGREGSRLTWTLGFVALLAALLAALYQLGQPPGGPPAGPAPPGGGPVVTAYPLPTAPPVLAPTSRPLGVLIADVVLKDPAFPNESEEYVQIVNNTDGLVDMAGWRLVNASRADQQPYIFPRYVLQPDYTIAVFSRQGESDVEQGDFYWGQRGEVWRAGDRAELRDGQGNLIAALTVPSYP